MNQQPLLSFSGGINATELKQQNINKIALIDATYLIYVSSNTSMYSMNIKNNIEQILTNTGCTKYIPFVDTHNTFRVKMYPEYKANRKDREKPIYFDECKQYIIEELGYYVIDNIEVDDAISICSNQLNQYNKLNTNNNNIDFIICSCDKDLCQIPAMYYNILSQETINNYEPNITLSKRNKLISSNYYTVWSQCITGDSTDNIKGLYRYGPVRAYEYLKGLTEDECIDVVYDLYKRVYGSSANDMFNMTYTLVKMLDKPYEYCNLDVLSIKQFGNV